MLRINIKGCIFRPIWYVHIHFFNHFVARFSKWWLQMPTTGVVQWTCAVSNLGFILYLWNTQLTELIPIFQVRYFLSLTIHVTTNYAENCNEWIALWEVHGILSSQSVWIHILCSVFRRWRWWATEERWGSSSISSSTATVQSIEKNGASKPISASPTIAAAWTVQSTTPSSKYNGWGDWEGGGRGQGCMSMIGRDQGEGEAGWINVVEQTHWCFPAWTV